MDDEKRRTVAANSLYSPYLPEIRVEVAGGLSYVGDIQINLYDLALADVYIFAATAGRQVTRLLWVQFEGFYDSNSKTYNYPVTRIARLGEHDYVHDFAAIDPAAVAAERPGGEWATISALLAGQGYALPGEVVVQRFVRVLGEDRRNEILIIYAEDIRDTGYTPDDFATPEREAAVAPRLLADARAAFIIADPSSPSSRGERELSPDEFR